MMNPNMRVLDKPARDFAAEQVAQFEGRVPFDREAGRNGPFFLPGPMIARDMILLQLSPLRACNSRCRHCYISNEHKKSTDVMDLEYAKYSFDVLFDFASYIHAGGLEVEILGGEINLMPTQLLYDMATYMLDKAMDHLEWRAAVGQAGERMIIESGLITNLIHTPPDKLDLYVAVTEYFRREMARRQHLWDKNEMTFGILTSFEPDTRRFNNERALQSWKDSIRTLHARGAGTHIIYTLTKGTLEMTPAELHALGMGELQTAEYSMDYTSPYGEGGVNRSTIISDDYERTARWMTEFSRMGNQINPNLPYLKAIDPPTEKGRTMEYFHNRLLAEAMIDYDGAMAVEEMMAPTTHWQGKAQGKETRKLHEMTRKEAVACLIESTRARHRADWRELVKHGCLACRHVVECQGGHQHFRSIFNKSGQCMGMKPYLDAMFPEE